MEEVGDPVPRRARSVAVHVSSGCEAIGECVIAALSRPGFFVTARDSGNADIAIVADGGGEQTYGLLSDLSLGGFAGPIVVVSAHAEPKRMADGFAAGAHAWTLSPPSIA